MKLYIIAGHGAGDPGACANGYSEAERVRALASEIKRRGGDSVVLLDTNRNWYADNGVSSLSIPEGDCLVELHMDSSASSARGGHVIIKAGIGGADKYDRALASGVSRIFPGRSVTIAERSDLANPNRAYRRGINYRLVENGFISNAGDLSTFNSRIGELADMYLEAFGIKHGASAPAAPAPAPQKVDIDAVNHGVYRLYNASTGDHLFTADLNEAETVAGMGWSYEGTAFKCSDSGTEVYRMYNPGNGLHMLTADHNEHDSMLKSGWVCEGVGFRVAGDADVYRLYNAGGGQHMYTADANERQSLLSAGWGDEGVAFKAAL